MKLCKLMVHMKNFNGEDLLINPKDFPNIKKGDIIEIYHPEDEFSRLLLQVTLFKEDLQGRDVISIEQSIASSFQLRTYADVIVNPVEPSVIALDSVEIIFKDQYLGRSEMWRLKNSLVNTCVHINKKIEFCGGSVRCQVYEMWSQGERVACGLIVDSTKIVFRSLTSMVYLFIQMSSEMWDFDIHGDLYFEKTINGFLTDLFQKWKSQGSNHEVTIVLFSRNFYKATSLDEFPQFMRQCLQQDYRGRFYEDFYRVAVQNERYDDWSHVIVQLRKLFADYKRSVLEYNSRRNVVVPEAVNSTAAQGNFLEVLNMSLNVFEKHYLDRSFDRTGQLSVVITPGVGVFEVDRELTNVTKQRVIDNGVGSDLVCLGEQPLHAVPLFKFHNKDTTITADDYSMPHWINLSFYSSNKRVGYSNFVPRIKLPPRLHKPPPGPASGASVRSKTVFEEEDFATTVIDYKAYDDQVFTMPSVTTNRNMRPLKKTSVPGSCSSGVGGGLLEAGGGGGSVGGSGHRLAARRKLSDPDIHFSSSSGAAELARSPAISIPSHRPPHPQLTPSELATTPSFSEVKSREDLTDSSPPVHSRALVGSTGGSPSVVVATHFISGGGGGAPGSLGAGGAAGSLGAGGGGGATGSIGGGGGTVSAGSLGGGGGTVGAGSLGGGGGTVGAGSLGGGGGTVGAGSLGGGGGTVGVGSLGGGGGTVGAGSLGGGGGTVGAGSLGGGSLGGGGGSSLHAASPLLRPGRALINPFDPSHITIKLTSNRRRWTHIFPKGPTGNLIQQHHYKASESSLIVPNPGPPISDMDKIDGKMKARPSILTLGSTPVLNRKTHTTLLWGATGEQEWTPALTTGVDWKSLTIPACLPITTDYFPDEVCLRTDYVFSDYNLLPEAVNADYATARVIYRKPLSTREVFKELVSQRLAQGFQIIVEEYSGGTPSLSGGGGPGGSSSLVVGSRGLASAAAGGGGTSASAASTSAGGGGELDSWEYKLSIGRVFHRLALSGSELRVTRYRPRHPYPPFDFHYRYRFQAPDHNTYDVSWISFTTEKLENFNWNYLDNYICTRGDTDFALVETLKYWRFRVYLLPLCTAVTKKILDGTTHHCDHYLPFSVSERTALTENFIRFIEQFVNKIKRNQNQKKHRLDLSALNLPNHLGHRRYSTGLIHLKSSVVGGNSPFRERLGSNRLPDKPRPRSGSKVIERGRASPAIENLSIAAEVEHPETDQDGGGWVILREGSTGGEIAEALRHPVSGLLFLSSAPSFPPQSFVSSDCVHWLMLHLEGLPSQERAIAILQDMIEQKYICHASGDSSFPFIYGFYLYYLVKGSKDETKGEGGGETVGDVETFQTEWVEVEVRPPAEVLPVPAFLAASLPPPCSQLGHKGPLYKESGLEMDVNLKSERAEWGHVKYHSVYRADLAYEMVVKWAAASGSIVADLVFGWARKAQSCGLQMVPVPADPFALPYSLKSDPLRGPVFIPLETECLMDTKSYLFQDFPEESWPTRLVLFQEAIALAFGFFCCSVDGSHQHNQYIHLSGNVFLLIPTVPCEHSREIPATRSRPARRQPIPLSEGTSPHHEYITRHVGPQPHAHEARIGFLWSWNHMVSRRWRLGPNNAIGDEAFQNKLLGDFRQFCANQDNRLRNFWDAAWEKTRSLTQQPHSEIV